MENLIPYLVPAVIVVIVVLLLLLGYVKAPPDMRSEEHTSELQSH